jgi:hypothetical protein
MAEVLLSPGVLARENDQSFISGQPVQAGAAILGPTVKGPVGLPTLVTSYSEYQRTFGAIVESGSAEFTYFTSISAYNYFQQGGDSLLVTRVVSGSYTSATSTAIQNDVENGTLEELNSATKNSFNITGSTGTKTGISASATTGASSNVTASFVIAESESISSITLTQAAGTFAVGDVLTFTSQSLGSDKAGGTNLTLTLVDANITNQTALELETLSEGVITNSGTATGSNGTLTSGSKDNIRWEIAQPNTSSGTFNLLIRRGDDTTTSKTVLETWTNLSMDPNSTNYVEKVIGNSKQTVVQDAGSGEYYVKNEGTFNTLSNFVRVKSVSSKTLNYFDNNGTAKSSYTASIPLAGSGSFTGAVGAPFQTNEAKFNENIDATDTQGLVPANYAISLQLLSNRDAYRYNLITAPGLCNSLTGHAAQITTMINNSEFRGDNIAVVDLVPWNTGLNSVTSQAASRDTSYAATYWPWLQTIDPDLGGLIWVPASAMIPGVYAFNDRAGEAWFAPAGLNRGGLGTVVRAERKLTNGNRDTLYQGNVNPIATFPNTGVVVFGQKTLQKKASALDRVNVRRLLIALKGFISQIADNLVFEQNTIATRNNFLTQVNPYLESVQQRQGLFAFKVVMDDSNNTPDVIDRNQLIGQIYIQPTKTAEFIYLDFNILPTGATFPV